MVTCNSTLTLVPSYATFRKRVDYALAGQDVGWESTQQSHKNLIWVAPVAGFADYRFDGKGASREQWSPDDGLQEGFDRV